MFRRQIEIQLSIEKMFDKDATISGKDIDDYISSNKDYFKGATDPAKIRDEAQTALKQQKIGALFEPWFTDLRKNAKVSTSL
jgi:hypothetical protein